MRAHAFDPWDAYTCRICGARESHPDMRPAALIRDGVIGFLLVFLLLVSCITAVGS